MMIYRPPKGPGCGTIVTESTKFEPGGNNIKRRIIRRPAAGVTLLLLGITMIIAGFSAGESIQVLHKAVRVCLECIGIG